MIQKAVLDTAHVVTRFLSLGALIVDSLDPVPDSDISDIRRTYTDLIGEVLQKGQVRNTRNGVLCMNRCLSVDEAKEYVRIVVGGVL